MVDMYTLQQQIVDNPEYIETILEALGCHDIKDHGNYYSAANEDGDNASAINIWKDNLFYKNYTRGKSGNIYTFVANKMSISFGRSLEWICKTLGLKSTHYSFKDVVLPFGGFYKKIEKEGAYKSYLMPEYSEDDLPEKNNYSQKFLNDGIALDIQEKYGIRFCHEENSILIPIYDCYDRLVGCKGRNNSDDNFSMRWYAYLPYQKNNVVYGWNFNYTSITKKRKVIIVESEKSVLQAASFNCYLCVAIAGHSISETQAKLIKLFMTEEIIIGFDEDIIEDELIYECKKLLVDSSILKNKVGYIFDDGEVRSKGSKLSPTDLGKDIFKKLIKEYVRWI